MSKIEFMHYRSPAKPQAGATVAILPSNDNKTAVVAIARCGPHDMFQKKVGRAIATGRINAWVKDPAANESLVTFVDIIDRNYLKAEVAEAINATMVSFGFNVE